MKGIDTRVYTKVYHSGGERGKQCFNGSIDFAIEWMMDESFTNIYFLQIIVGYKRLKCTLVYTG